MAQTTQPTEAPTGLARYVPILRWAPDYQRSWLRPDLIAGLTVAALVVPKALGYAGIAGVPIEYGLYAAAAGAILYALVGGSSQIATGPSSALAAVAAGALLTAGVSSDEDAIALVAAITFVSGLLYLALALLRMGWISQFLSKAVITGFLFGAAIQVVIGELPKLTGTEAEGSNSWRKLGDWIDGLGDTDATTLLVGASALALIFGLRIFAPKAPRALVLVVLGIAASVILGLEDEGVAVVGDVPRGLPSVTLPDWEFVRDNIQVIAGASVGLLLIGFSQTAGDARSFATKHGYRVDINQESAAQGVANVGSGLVQGIPVSTSLSASSLNDESGARTPVASLTTGVLVVLTLLVLAPLFSDLPNAVLAAVIIDAVTGGMMDVAEMRRLRRVKRTDFWIALAAIVGVLSAGVLAGVLIGVALSILWLISVSTRPETPLLGRKSGTQIFRSLDEFPDGETYPGLAVLRFDSGLFFASADALEDQLRDLSLTADPPLHTVVISFEGIGFIDSQGSALIAHLIEVAPDLGVQVRLARVKGPVREVLQVDGVIDALGEEHVYGNVYEAVADLLPEAEEG